MAPVVLLGFEDGVDAKNCHQVAVVYIASRQAFLFSSVNKLVYHRKNPSTYTESRQPSWATAMAVVFLDAGDQSDFNM